MNEKEAEARPLMGTIFLVMLGWVATLITALNLHCASIHYFSEVLCNVNCVLQDLLWFVI